MNHNEILQEIRSVVRVYMSPSHLKQGETVSAMEGRQQSQLLELYGMLALPPSEYVSVAIDTAMVMLQHKQYASVVFMTTHIISDKVRQMNALSSTNGLTTYDKGQVAMCSFLQNTAEFYLRIHADVHMVLETTTNSCIRSLENICASLEPVFDADEELYHVMYNGTVLLFKGALVLVKYGLVKEAVLFLGFCVRCCESSVLDQTKFLSWRVRILKLISLCYEGLSDVNAAQKVSTFGVDSISEIIQLEFSDEVAPPAHSVTMLRNAFYEVKTLAFKHAVLTLDKEEPSGDGKKGGTAQGLSTETLTATLQKFLTCDEPGLKRPDSVHATLANHANRLRALLATIEDCGVSCRMQAQYPQKSQSETVQLKSDSFDVVANLIDEIFTAYFASYKEHFEGSLRPAIENGWEETKGLFGETELPGGTPEGVHSEVIGMLLDYCIVLERNGRIKRGVKWGEFYADHKDDTALDVKALFSDQQHHSLFLQSNAATFMSTLQSAHHDATPRPDYTLSQKLLCYKQSLELNEAESIENDPLKPPGFAQYANFKKNCISSALDVAKTLQSNVNDVQFELSFATNAHKATFFSVNSVEGIDASGSARWDTKKFAKSCAKDVMDMEAVRGSDAHHIPVATLADSALFLYKTLTNNGDPDIIDELDEDGFTIIESVAQTLLHVNYHDLALLAGIIHLFAKYSEAKLDCIFSKSVEQKTDATVSVSSISLGNLEESSTVNTQNCAHLAAISDKEQVVVSPLRLLKAVKSKIERCRRIYSKNVLSSDSLLYKTLAVQHGTTDAFCVRLTMKAAVLALWKQRLLDQDQKIRTLLTREAQSHLFGQLSAQEQHVLAFERSFVVARPVVDEACQRKLLSQRSGSSFFTALAYLELAPFTKNGAEALKKLHEAYRHILAGVGDGDGSVLSPDTLPAEYLWCCLSLTALRYEGRPLVHEALGFLRAAYTIETHPADDPLWVASPLVLLDTNAEKVAKTPHELLLLVAKAFTAAAEAKRIDSLQSFAMKRDEHFDAFADIFDFADNAESSFDKKRFALPEIQQVADECANLTLISLKIASSTGSAVLIAATCHNLYNILRPLLRPTNPQPTIIRPLYSIAKSLVNASPSLIMANASHQALLIRTISDLYRVVNCFDSLTLVDSCIVSGEGGSDDALLSSIIALFRQAYSIIEKHPNQHIRVRCKTLHDIRSTLQCDNAEDIPSILACGNGNYNVTGATGGAKKDDKKAKGGAAAADEPSPREVNITVNMLPPSGGPATLSDRVPAELVELLHAIILGNRNAIPFLLEESPLPDIYTDVLQKLHEGEYNLAFDALSVHKRDPLFPSIALLVIQCALRARKPSTQSLVENLLTVLAERKRSFAGIVTVCTSHVEDALIKLRKGDTSPVPSKEKDAKGKAAKADDVSPEDAKQKRSISKLKWGVLYLVLRARLRQVRAFKARIMYSDLPAKARCFEILAAISLEQSSPHKAAIMSKLCEATSDGPPPGLTPEETTEYWTHDVSCLSHLTRSAVLYGRCKRWKHVYNSLTSLCNAFGSFFPGEIPLVLTMPQQAKSTDAMLQPLTGLVQVVQEAVNGASLRDGLLLCRKDLRSTVHCCEELLRELSRDGNEDSSGLVSPYANLPTRMELYINMLSAACIETYCEPDIKSASSSTVLQLNILRGVDSLSRYYKSLANIVGFFESLHQTEFCERCDILTSERKSYEEMLLGFEADIGPNEGGETMVPEHIEQTEASDRLQEKVWSYGSVCYWDGNKGVVQEEGAVLASFFAKESPEENAFDEMLELLSSTVVSGKRVVFVKKINEGTDIYSMENCAVINTTHVPELLRAYPKPGKIVIGAASTCRRAAHIINSFKYSDFYMKEAAESLSSQTPSPLDGNAVYHQAPLIHPGVFKNCRCNVTIFDVHTKELITHPVARVLENDFKLNNEWFLISYDLQPAKLQSAGSGRITLSNKETAHLITPSHDTLQAVLTNLGGLDLGRLITLTETCMRGLQYSSAVSSNLSAVDSVEQLNIILKNKYAAQLLPLCMMFQAASGRSLTKSAKLLAAVFRDLPRAEVLVQSGEFALQEYMKSTAYAAVLAEVEKDRQARGGRGTVVTSKSSGAAKKAVVRNEHYKDICQRFTQAYTFFRQKHLTLPAMRIVYVLGGLQAEHQAAKEAGISWQDGVDIAFGHVNSWTKWRECVKDVDGEPLLARLGTTKALLAIVLLFKLASQSLQKKQFASCEHCMLAARLSKAVLSSCRSQPARECDFWQCPADILLDTDVFSGSLGVDGKDLMVALAYVASQCQKIGHDALSIPAAALLEYVASETMRSWEYTVIARCLKIRGLAAMGDMRAMSCVMRTLTKAVSMPSVGVQQVEGWKMSGVDAVSASTNAAAVKKPPPKKGGPAKTEGEETGPVLLCNDRLLNMTDTQAVEELASPLPEVIASRLDNTLGTYVTLTQAQILVRLAASCPHLAVEGGRLSANHEGKQIYAKVLSLAEGLATSVEESQASTEEAVQQSTPVGQRTITSHAMAIRAQTHAVRGHYQKALQVLTALLEYHSVSYEMTSDVVGCESFIASLGVADVCAWHIMRADALLQLRRPLEAQESCANCGRLATKYQYTHGERDAMVMKARICLRSGLDHEAAAILTHPQTTASNEEGEANTLPDVGRIARVGAPTRLREAPDPHSGLMLGGGLLEGMPIEVLQVDHGYSLVKSDEGVQGFMPTKDLRPGLHAQPRAPPEPPQRPSLVEEALRMDYESRDVFLPRVLSLAATAVFADECDGRLDTGLGLLYGGMSSELFPERRKKGGSAGKARTGGGGRSSPTASEYNMLAMKHYLAHLKHLGFDLGLDSKWSELYNCHMPVVREAAMACTRAGREFMLREDHSSAEDCFRKACAIATQCRGAFPFAYVVASLHLARCIRLGTTTTTTTTTKRTSETRIPRGRDSTIHIARAQPTAPRPILEAGTFPSSTLPTAPSQEQALACLASSTPHAAEAASLLCEAVEALCSQAPYEHDVLHTCYMELACLFGSAANGVHGDPESRGSCQMVFVHCLKLAATVAAQRNTLACPQQHDTPLTHSFAKEGAVKGLGLSKEVDIADISTLVATDVQEVQRRNNAAQGRYLEMQAEAVLSADKPTLQSYASWQRDVSRELHTVAPQDTSPEVKLSEWRTALQTFYGSTPSAPPLVPGEIVFKPSAPQATSTSLLSCVNSETDAFGSTLNIGFCSDDIVFISQMYTVGDVQLPAKKMKPGEPVSSLPMVPPLHWVAAYKRNVGEDVVRTVTILECIVEQRDLRAVRGVCEKLVALVARIVEREEELAQQMDADDKGGKAAPPKKGKEAGTTPPPAARGPTPDVRDMEEAFDELCIDFADAMVKMHEGARDNVAEGEGSDAAPVAASAVPEQAFFPPLSLGNRDALLETHASAVLLSALFDPSIGMIASSSTNKLTDKIAAWVLAMQEV